MQFQWACARAAMAASVLGGPAAWGQLRVAEWNVTNYSGGREEAFQTALYGVFQGRSMAPDVLIGQEFLSQAGVDEFLAILNGAPGSPGDWKAGPFFNGPDSDNAFFYRGSKVDLVNATVVSPGGDPPRHPRNVVRYDIRPKGYASKAAMLACYSSHMKSGATETDRARRLDEALAIRADSSALPGEWNYLLGADTNIRDSSEVAYAALADAATGADGLFFDPIATPGAWYANALFRFVHTQDPAGGGGMDDRFDQVLVSASLLDRAGFEYIGEPALPYSTDRWDDPNHSFRSWGNDGTSFNLALTVDGNTMVGPVIAQALRTAASNTGHLPVYLDLRVPAKVQASAVLDFGTVRRGFPAPQTLTVSNSGNTSLWTAAGIADLHYDLGFTPGFTSPAGPFVEAPGGGPNSHTVFMDTSETGVKQGLATITSDAPESRVVYAELKGEVVAGCYADFNGDGTADLFDFLAYVNAFSAGEAPADCSADGRLDLFDFLCFVNAFNLGC